MSTDNLLSLYTRIPDYSEVKHLGQSDFINTLERLKEEFRQCRASLYREETSGANGQSSGSGDDVDFLADRTSKVLNINSSHNRETFSTLKNSNVTRSFDNNLIGGGDSLGLLSIKGCELHRSPYATHSTTGAQAFNHINYNKPSRALSVNFDTKNNLTDSAFHEDEDYDDDRLESDSDTSRSDDLSKWSSSPDLFSRPYVPPSNVEKRILERKSHNNSAPSLSAPEDEKPIMFRANPVPSHVYKPLYDFIRLKNARRSQKVREQSKQRLLAQVKPFSFAKDPKPANTGGSGFRMSSANSEKVSNNKEVLNNTKPIKSKKYCASGHANIKTMNYFKANPAPPRTKALMAAMKLKEQQEYRELKKRLRAEALLKNATLPPSMAARDKRVKLSNAKLDSILQEYQNSYNSAKDIDSRRQYRETSAISAMTDETSIHTDEDRLSEDSYKESTAAFGTTKPFCLGRKTKNFTPYGKSRHSSATTGVFECTSNDNLASKLRIQSTRKRESERMKREEEELLKLMRNENRRKKLKDSHLHAWRRAHSYSSTQDIAMRSQLRMAASILERETFVREMSRMLSRVRSAPLLLEGVRQERKSEPCKKHKQEFLQLNHRSNNKCSDTPRFQKTGGGGEGSNWTWNRYAEEQSETAAMAEGSLTNSDNESVGNITPDSVQSDNEEENEDKGDDEDRNQEQCKAIGDTHESDKDYEEEIDDETRN